MSKLGMWQPTKKDGKNWKVIYCGIHEGKPFNQTRTFRIRENARRFIKDAKNTFLLAGNDSVTFEIKKITD